MTPMPIKVMTSNSHFAVSEMTEQVPPPASSVRDQRGFVGRLQPTPEGPRRGGRRDLTALDGAGSLRTGFPADDARQHQDLWSAV